MIAIYINKMVANRITITTGPVVKAETHIKFVDGTEGDYLIEGAMDCPALVVAGLMPPGSGTEQPPSWIKYPAEVEIGSAVTSIGDNAFWECGSLTSVTIPNSVTSVGKFAFLSCSGLTSVTIPDSMTSIGQSAFGGCSGLTSVEIPNSVTSIGSSAFDCIGFTSATFLGKTKATVRSMTGYYWGFPPGCVLHCTDGDITL